MATGGCDWGGGDGERPDEVAPADVALRDDKTDEDRSACCAGAALGSSVYKLCCILPVESVPSVPIVPRVVAVPCRCRVERWAGSSFRLRIDQRLLLSAGEREVDGSRRAKDGSRRAGELCSMNAEVNMFDVVLCSRRTLPFGVPSDEGSEGVDGDDVRA